MSFDRISTAPRSCAFDGGSVRSVLVSEVFRVVPTDIASRTSWRAASFLVTVVDGRLITACAATPEAERRAAQTKGSLDDMFSSELTIVRMASNPIDSPFCEHRKRPARGHERCRCDNCHRA